LQVVSIINITRFLIKKLISNVTMSTKMQEQKTESEKKLEGAKERLRNALTNLDLLIKKQNENLNEERKIRTEVIKDLDGHIENLETILKK
jgi:hypothetical protein